jgi:hypothetical protein
MVQVVKGIPRKSKALSSNPSIDKKKMLQDCKSMWFKLDQIYVPPSQCYLFWTNPEVICMVTWWLHSRQLLKFSKVCKQWLEQCLSVFGMVMANICWTSECKIKSTIMQLSNYMKLILCYILHMVRFFCLF